MKRPLLLISAAVLSYGIAAPVFGQMATGENVPMPPHPKHTVVNPEPPISEYGEHHPYVTEFNGYLDSHPDEAAALRKDPRLVRNPNYLASHPDLQSYLKAHPQVAERYERHPDYFMHREHRYERSEKRYDKRHHLPKTD